jgi:hypothetical protein
MMLVPNNPVNLLRSNGHRHEATYLTGVTYERYGLKRC